jgi:hypothetical protein
MELVSVEIVSDRLRLDFCRVAAFLANEEIRGSWSRATVIELISQYCSITKADIADRIAIGETLLDRPDSIADRAHSLTL